MQTSTKLLLLLATSPLLFGLSYFTRVAALTPGRRADETWGLSLMSDWWFAISEFSFGMGALMFIGAVTGWVLIWILED